MKFSLFGKKRGPAVTQATLSLNGQDFSIPDEKLNFILSSLQRTDADTRPSDPIVRTLSAFGETYDREEKLTFENIEKMRNDEQIHAANTTLRLGLTAYPFTYYNPDPQIHAFINDALDAVKGGRIGIIKELYQAIVYGFTSAERVLQYHGDKEKIFINQLKTLRHSEVEFRMNDKGTDIDWQGSPILYTQPDSGQTAIPASKLLIWTYNGQYGDPYGRSQFKACYRPWFIKRAILQAWGIGCERHGSPWVTAESPSDDESVMNKIMNALKKLTTDSVCVFSAGTKASIVQPNFNADTFERFVNYLDRMLFRAWTMPALVLTEGESRGSYALGKNHFDLFLWNILDLRNQFSDEILRQIVAVLVFINFGPEAPLGTVTWPRMRGEGLLAMLDTFARYANKGLFAYPELSVANAFREMLDLPALDEKTLPEVTQKYYEYLKMQSLIQGSVFNPDEEADEKRLERPITLAKTAKTDKHAAPKGLSTSRKSAFLALEKGTNELKPRIAKVYSKIKPDLSASGEKTANSLKKYSEKEKLTASDKKKIQEISGKVAADVWPKSFKTDLQLALQPSLEKTAESAQTQAIKELKTIKKNKSEDFQNDIALDAISFEVPPTEAIENYTLEFVDFKNKEEIQSITDSIVKYIERLGTEEKTFDLADMMLAIQAQLDISKARSETIARTETTRAYNLGRLHEYKQDPEFVKGYRFSAILDDRTTPYCQEIDGKQISAEEFETALLPPFHFGCRTMIEAVTEYAPRQEYDEIELPPDDFKGDE